ncbi:DUF6763 family protein [Salinisphaera sp. P385]|uniref:DUF6763 family protein n=1 Tax=Spectribacter acetivorans TaxID=3075603 RepID=A0ABU3BDZ0_9GAMM|nr:DUF6763 family protein [Salinisphaera sp. P385]MDT0619711.1 DUF6763 family protein [Salinisphaera sp. P385]
MPRRLYEIEIGDWYHSPWTSARFEVVAMDEASRAVEIQYEDGTVEEIDYESWPQLEAEDAGPPDDVTGALDTEPEDDDRTGLNLDGLDDPFEELDYLLH